MRGHGRDDDRSVDRLIGMQGRETADVLDRLDSWDQSCMRRPTVGKEALVGIGRERLPLVYRHTSRGTALEAAVKERQDRAMCRSGSICWSRG